MRRIDRNGVFIGIKDTMETGLLHISNVSRKHVPDVSVSACSGLSWWLNLATIRRGWLMVGNGALALDRQCSDPQDPFPFHTRIPALSSGVQEVFSVGEMVWVMVMGFEPGFGKVSFSTAELEVEDGDIMTNKELCWENRGEWLVW